MLWELATGALTTWSGPNTGGKKMDEKMEVERWLRRRVLGLLHAGRLRPGERLPSIRQVTQQTGADHRVVAEAYRVLEREGLVTIRPGSGVYAAQPEQTGGVLSETIRWIAGVLLDGWERGLSRAEVGELVRRSTATRLRCACLESNEDHMVAMCAELEEAFGLEPVPMRVALSTSPNEVPAGELAGVDLVVTTVFHADLARAVALRVGKPAVVVTFHPDFTSEVARKLGEGTITAVFVDPRYEERARSFLTVPAHPDQLRFVPVDRVDEEALDLARADVLVTRAARRRLGMEDFHLSPPPPPVTSPASARELLGVAVRLAMKNGGDSAKGSPAGR